MRAGANTSTATPFAKDDPLVKSSALQGTSHQNGFRTNCLDEKSSQPVGHRKKKMGGRGGWERATLGGSSFQPLAGVAAAAAEGSVELFHLRDAQGKVQQNDTPHNAAPNRK